jgi:omega-amidase
VRFAVFQYDVAWMDRAANWATVHRLAESANLVSGDYVLLPELGDTGFTMDPPPAGGPDPVAEGAALARAHGVLVQVGHAEPDAPGGRLWNVASVFRPDGTLAAQYRKIHLFSPGHEDRHYAPGEAIALIDVDSSDGTWRIAPFICYDLRFPELFRIAALAGAHVFTIGASWPAPRALHRRALAVARAIENQAYVVACNRIGRDPNTDHAGDSFAVAPGGDVIGEAGDAERVLIVDADRDALMQWRDRFPALRDLRRAFIGSIAVR